MTNVPKDNQTSYAPHADETDEVTPSPAYADAAYVASRERWQRMEPAQPYTPGGWRGAAARRAQHPVAPWGSSIAVDGAQPRYASQPFGHYPSDGEAVYNRAAPLPEASVAGYNTGLSYPFVAQRPTFQHAPAQATPAYGPTTQNLPVPNGSHALTREQMRDLPPALRHHLIQLQSEANSWILIGIVGFFLGFGMLSGPLTWKKGADLRREYERCQLQPSAEANVAYYTGMLSTMLVGVSLVFLLLMFSLL